MKKINKNDKPVVKRKKLILVAVLFMLFGALTYFGVEWYSDIDAQTSIGPNIGLGVAGLSGGIVFWTSAVFLVFLLFRRS